MNRPVASVVKGLIRRAYRCQRLCLLLLVVAWAPKIQADADVALQCTWPGQGLQGSTWVVGRTNTFTLTLSNLGPETATQVLLTNHLPALVSCVSVIPSQGSCSNDGVVVYSDLGDLTNQQSAFVSITVLPTGAGMATNLAGAFSSASDPNPTNNSVRNTAFIRPPYLSIANTSVVEGNDGLTNATFLVWLESPSPLPVSVNYQTANQTALAGLDYIAASGILVFAPGVTTQMVFIAVVGDLLYETSGKINGETFYLNLGNPTNAQFADQRGSAICTILDDDPMPSLTIGDISLVEGETGTTQAVFNVTLSAPSGMTTTFHWATADGTATAGSDFAAGSGSKTISAGQTNCAISVTVYGDRLLESDETFLLVLSSPQYATLARTQAVCTIVSDELVLSLPAEVQENAGLLAGAGLVGIGGTNAVDLVVALSNNRPDLLSLPASVVIVAGATNASFDLVILDDSLLNGSRTVNVTASAPLHASTSASVVVNDDETTSLSLQVPGLVEEGSGTCTGRVFAATPPDRDVDISLFSSNTNRVQPPPSIVLPAGQTSASFLLGLPNDFQLDGNELVTLTAHVQNWGDGTNTLMVMDRTNMTLTLPTPLVEGQWATGLVQASACATTNLTISLATGDNPALLLPATLQLPAGQLSNTFAFQAVDDAVYRGTQTVLVVAQSPWLRSVTNSVTVLENDPHHFTLSRVPVSQQAYVYYYDLILTACDASGAPLPAFNRPATLSAAGLEGAVDVRPAATLSFNQGVCTQYYYFHSWDNNVRLTVSDGQGHTGQSNPFNIPPPSHHSIDLAVNDLAWDAVRGRICASVMNYWNSISNTLAFINPYNGKIESTLYVGPGPGRLAISDDSHYLYIGLTGTNLVRRLDLATRTIDLEFSIGAYVYGGGLPPSLEYVDDMHVQPGNPDVVAIARMRPGVSPRAAGVVVFDHGIERPSVYGDVPSFGPNYIEFGGWPTRLYGYDTQVSTFTFHRMDVTASGVVGDSAAWFMQGYGLDFRYSNGRIYVSNGQVFDPESGSFLGQLPSGGVPIPAPEIGKVLFIRQNGSSADLLQIFDESTLGWLSDQYIPNGGGTAASGIRWGDSGVAFRVTGNGYAIYILRSDYLADLDANGLPDSWEREHFGAPGTALGAPEADPDGDGMSNFAEYVAGTDPLNANDVLRLGRPQIRGSDIIVTFSSVVGRCYRLEQTSDLSSGSWATVDELPGTGDQLVLTDPGAAGNTSRFYRLLVFF